MTTPHITPDGVVCTPEMIAFNEAIQKLWEKYADTRYSPELLPTITSQLNDLVQQYSTDQEWGVTVDNKTKTITFHRIS